MASTNKTTHYNLSQYVGSDKPTYLVDYNTDMSNIDSGIYNAQAQATLNETAIGDLTTLTTTANNDLVSAINEVDSHADTNANNISTNTTNIATNTSAIGTLTNLTTTNKANLVGAVNEVKSNVDNFNLTSITSYDTLSQYENVNSTGTLSYAGITVAKNSDGSLCKIYGRIYVNDVLQSGSINIKLNVDTGLRPTSDITIAPTGYVRFSANPSSDNAEQQTSITINTDGTINFNLSTNFVGSTSNCKGMFFPFLIFVKDFGDVA